MRKAKQSGNFILWLCLNMLLNWKGLIPAVVLLALRFWLHISLWWSLLAVIVWLLWLILWMAIIGWAGKCGSTSSPLQENKNPYSAKNIKTKTKDS